MTTSTTTELQPATAFANGNIGVRYQSALDALVGTLQQDRTILAAILCGSMAHDEVWDKSDIDLVIIGDETHKHHSVCLVEHNINIHAILTPRSQFKKILDGGLQSSFMHSFISKGRLLFTVDESLKNAFADLGRIGERDREVQLFRAGCDVLPILAKAQKWFHIKGDLHYSFAWILSCANALARVEIISQRQITGREVIQQALRLNPLFFTAIYTELIDGPKDSEAIGNALSAIQAYMTERTDLLFGLLLNFLSEAGGPRSMTELDGAFHNLLQGAPLDPACEWLADLGTIDKVGVPLRLSPKSRVTVSEAAFYYDGLER